MILQGKNAVITGARRGIGRAAVETFAREGANVWACARMPDAAFEQEMVRLAAETGVWIRPLFFDLTDEAGTRQAVQSIVQDKLPIDVLVNNAGEAQYDLFAMLPAEHLRHMLECNYIAPLRFTQMLVRRMMRSGGGSVVFLSSVTGQRAESGSLAYGGSKAAVAHAVGVLSRELAPGRIRVNGVAPGLVDTDMQQQADSAYRERLLAGVALKRMARPEEIANVIAFLASDMSSYMTGQVVRVDGGM